MSPIASSVFSVLLGAAICVASGAPTASSAVADELLKQKQPEEEARARYDADNTARNVRDRGRGSITPLDQSLNAELTQITASVRSAIVSDKTLSTYAHNIKIVTTDDGRVWLRGPVESVAERDRVTKIARQVIGERPLVDQLEIVETVE